MKDEEKTRSELIAELIEARQRLSERCCSESDLGADALNQCEERYKAYVENAPTGIFIVDAAGKYIDANEAACRMTGYSRDELLSKSLADLVSPSALPKTIENFGKLRSVGKLEDELPLVRSDGLEVDVLLRAVQLSDERYMAFCTDISESKQAYAAQDIHLRFLERMANIDRVIHRSGELEEMLAEVLQTSLEIFETDRAWLLFPCDPDAQTWSVPMERTRPEFPGAFALGEELPMIPEVAMVLRVAADVDDVITVDYRTQSAPQATGERFSIRSQMHMIVRPKTGQPWLFGLHQCSGFREWSEEEIDLFREIGHRLGDGLTSMLLLRDLRASEEKWRSLTVQSADHIALLDCDGTINFVNRGSSGVEPEELIGTSALDSVPEKFREDVAECYQRVIETGEIGSYETASGDEGESRYFEARVAPLLDEGKTVALLVSSHDITERRESEEMLRRYEHIVSSSRDMLALIDDRFVYLAANKAYAGAFGLSVEEFVGSTVAEAFGDEEMQRIVGQLAERCFAGESVNFQKWIEFPSLGARFMDVSYYPFEGRSDDVKCFAVCGRDITERMQAQEDRLALERQVLHAQKLESLGVLAGGIAHDFNNLLMAILGNADLALAELRPMSPARASVREIEKATRRAAELAKQMLAYSGKGQFLVERIVLWELVEEIAHLLKVSISKKAVLQYDFANDVPTFDGDVTQIRQVIMNLITNASEAIGDDDGVIVLSTGAMDCDRAYLDDAILGVQASLDEPLPEGPHVWLEVTDTGCGMDAETIGKIFDPFFTSKFTGRGLGMSAVLGIVRGHRGAIKVLSEVGKGTTFRILFPANDPSVKPPGKRGMGSADEDDWSGSGTVLVADDEKTIRIVARKMLERMGFSVLTVADGREAVKVFRDHADEIECVLLDLTMPHMNGVEAFHEMQRIDPGLCVVLCSGYSELEALEQFSDGGPSGYLQKPFSMASLKAKLMELHCGESPELPSETPIDDSR